MEAVDFHKSMHMIFTELLISRENSELKISYVYKFNLLRSNERLELQYDVTHVLFVI